eukprot:TRINITY_DN10723_c0_g1_i2.p1 TRINITY_DN10723_c0_g1~~TRINITY_DN10723_c0_g1_i2.p1  ORF type:complete len:158 (+),score=6.89 TRINITY_DN10723_c0_g1_i2:67-540(+)
MCIRDRNITNLTDTIVFSNFQLDTAGFLYVVLLKNTSAMPTPADIRRGSGPSGNRSISAAVAYFDGVMWSPGQFTFASNLEAGETYILYWAATCDDPSEASISCMTNIMSNPVGITADPNKNPVETTSSVVLSSFFTVLVMALAGLFVLQLRQECIF